MRLVEHKGGFGRTMCAIALVAIAAIGVPGATANLRSPGEGADQRYARMPEPVAFEGPTYTHDPATVQLTGMQWLYRFGESGAMTRRRRVDMGAARTFLAREQPENIRGRSYVLLTGGPYKGWRVRTPAVIPDSVVAYAPAATIRLASGNHAGVRLYANGRVMTVQTVTLDGAATVAAHRRVTFGGRDYLHLIDGPLADRWVAVGAGVSIVGESGGPGLDPVVPGSAMPLAATWKTIVLIYSQTDVTFNVPDGTTHQIHAVMDDSMHSLVLDTLDRTRVSVATWSGGLVTLDTFIIDVPHPLTELSQLANGGYWAGPRSVQADLDMYAPAGSYDSIVVVWQSEDSSGQRVPVPGWGLTVGPGPWANGAGYSSVIVPTELWWWTDSPAPEEVFVHEWMHQVIYFHRDAGRMDLDLHGGPSYGYSAQDGTWRRWLTDVMRGQVVDGDSRIGVTPGIWAAGTPTSP